MAAVIGLSVFLPHTGMVVPVIQETLLSAAFMLLSKTSLVN